MEAMEDIYVKGGNPTDGWTNVWTYGRTDGRTDGWMIELTDPRICERADKGRKVARYQETK